MQHWGCMRGWSCTHCCLAMPFALQATDVSSLLHGLAKLQILPAGAHYQGLLERLVACMKEMDAMQLTNCTWAMAMLHSQYTSAQGEEGRQRAAASEDWHSWLLQEREEQRREAAATLQHHSRQEQQTSSSILEVQGHGAEGQLGNTVDALNGTLRDSDSVSNGASVPAVAHHSSVSLQGQHHSAPAPDARQPSPSWQSEWEERHRVPVLLTPAARQVELPQQQKQDNRKQPLFPSHNGAGPMEAGHQQGQGGSSGGSSPRSSVQGGPSAPVAPVTGPRLHYRHYPTESLMSRLLSVAYTRLDSFHPIDLAIMAWSLAALRVTPPTVFLTALQRRAESVGSMFTPQVGS
jgi:hypothetical protein